MFLHTLNPYGLKCSQAHVEGDVSGFDAALPDAGQDLWGEMEARGWSGYRSSCCCIDGLVAFPVEGRIRAGNIGGKGDVSNLFEPGKKVRYGKKPNLPEILRWLKYS